MNPRSWKRSRSYRNLSKCKRKKIYYKTKMRKNHPRRNKKSKKKKWKTGRCLASQTRRK